MLVAIVGATGTGKSDLSIAVAQRLGMPVEIVGADAMQLYRGMDIGTAKLPLEHRAGIPHHLLDVLDPSEEASVARYQTDARAAIEQIEARGAIPILVGGSGLYVSSVLHEFDFPGTDPDVRRGLEDELERVGAAVMHSRLADRDPVAAHAIGPRNARRIVRALEVIELTGRPFGAGLPEKRPPWRQAMVLGLRAERTVLVDRLGSRAQRMWADGLLDEVRALRRRGLGLTASRAIGYAQALAQLDGLLDQSTAIDQTAALTRRLARRQAGWFGRASFTAGSAAWFDADDPELVDRALDAVRTAALPSGRMM